MSHREIGSSKGCFCVVIGGMSLSMHAPVSGFEGRVGNKNSSMIDARVASVEDGNLAVCGVVGDCEKMGQCPTITGERGHTKSKWTQKAMLVQSSVIIDMAF